MKKTSTFIILGVTIFGLLFAAVKFKGPKEKEIEPRELPVRQGAVAGSFYSAEKEILSEQIDGFLSKVTKQDNSPTILIVPHAGYKYSGQVASFGFGQLIDSPIERVIILGASHYIPFSGAAVFKEGFWQTPLGKVEIDSYFTASIIASSPHIFASNEYHRSEHSLEVEVPFLQKVLKDFKIVPILIGGEKAEKTINALSTALQKYIDSQTILVVSSDFSHYPSYEEAKKVDKMTIEAILSGETKTLENTISTTMTAGIANLSTCACGETAIKVGMKIAKDLGIDDIRLLNYANSGDVVTDTEKIVGYAAIGFYSERQGDELNHEEQEELLKISRRTLETYLKDQKIPDFDIKKPFLNRQLGAFVTLRKDDHLRGCIGRFEPNIPLWQVVREMSINAAVNDTRFTPVTFAELEKITIEISVLSPQKRIDSWQEVELGKHGVVVKKGYKSGVFLPQVATENNWDLNTFMGELCSQKIGLPRDCWQSAEVDLYIFTAQIFEEDYSTFLNIPDRSLNSISLGGTNLLSVTNTFLQSTT